MINIDVTSPKDTNKKGLGFTVKQWERNTKITRAVKSFSIHKYPGQGQRDSITCCMKSGRGSGKGI